MNASRNMHGTARQTAKWAVTIAVALTALASTTGCDETSFAIPVSVGSPINAATQNVPSWGGLANPYYTTSLGLPESPWSYWDGFFSGF